MVMGVEREMERWPVTAADVFTGLADWRAAHPRATLQEIERTLDERLALLRARMLEDLALASRQADVQALPMEERPVCPACGGRVEARGAKTRRLTTTYERQITLTRSYAVCPSCGTGLFPPG
jgi:YgiT-type zinc finger domain-containing protein